jgi:hypothetical protein
MRKNKPPSAKAVCRSIVVVALLALTSLVFHAAPALAQTNPPPFDFNDTFYLNNGIDPAFLQQRVGTSCNAPSPVAPPGQNPANWTFDNSNTDPNLNNVRILQTTGGFRHDGGLLYYSIMAFVPGPTQAGGCPLGAAGSGANVFTSDAAGQTALAIANRRQAFIFPIRNAMTGQYILSPALGNRRQDNLFDTSDGYLADDPLGLWILAFVELTPFGLSPQGQQILAPFAAANGVGTDGTPVVTTLKDINNLVSQGVFTIVNRDPSGSQGFPWVV